MAGLGCIRGEVRFKELLTYHTSLRVGGAARYFIVPQDVDDVRRALAFAREEGLLYFVIGGGNSILVRDGGFNGVVLKLAGCLGRAEFHGEQVVAGSGASISAVIREAAALNLGGLECLVGIPSTIGGALATNAGTSEGRIWDFVTTAYIVLPDGTLREVPGRSPSFSSPELAGIPDGAVIVGCRLRLVRRCLANTQKEIRRQLKLRKLAKALTVASVGGVWKDPAGVSVDTLITRVGLKGKRRAGAEISPKDANFIINREYTTAANVEALMGLVEHRVKKMFGITLERKIRIVGGPAEAYGQLQEQALVGV